MTDIDIIHVDELGVVSLRIDDSYTLMRGALYEDHCFTIHDEAGLDALPVGAQVLDVDGDRWVNLDHGWKVWFVADIKGGPYWQNVELISEQYHPFTLLNPQILGDLSDFAPEHECRPTDPDDLIRIGQRVRLVSSLHPAWNGLLVEVIQWDSDSGIGVFKPLSPRPDKAGLAPFTWSVSRVELASEKRAAA